MKDPSWCILNASSAIAMLSGSLLSLSFESRPGDILVQVEEERKGFGDPEGWRV